ncbi:MAG: hypothetical protein NTV33_00900 [Coprothermobacterota bacterium]|nr:hypothetical protein [Coprothermobacterota bacterium]
MTHFDTEVACQKEEDYFIPGTAAPQCGIDGCCALPGTAAPQCGPYSR